jgi:hypothetical protein
MKVGWLVATAPITALVAAIAAVVLIVGGLTGKMREMFAGFGKTFRNIGETFGKMWNGILAALKKGDFQSAWKIIQYGMYSIFLEVVALIRRKWTDFSNFFRDVFADVVLSIRNMFIDMVIGIIQGLNKLSSVLRDIAGLTNEDRAAVQAKVEKDFAPHEKEYRDTVNERTAIGKTIRANQIRLENPKLTDAEKQAISESTAMWEERLKKTEAQIQRLNRIRDDIRAKHLAGDKWIDTAGFEQAKKDLIEADKLERDLRNKAQDERIKGIEDEAKKYRDMIDEITKELNKVPNPLAPMPRAVGGTPVAPMPRIKELGDAVKGLYSSADYRGALSLGPANTIAQEQLEVESDILKEVQGLRQDVREHPGLVWG